MYALKLQYPFSARRRNLTRKFPTLKTKLSYIEYKLITYAIYGLH